MEDWFDCEMKSYRCNKCFKLCDENDPDTCNECMIAEAISLSGWKPPYHVTNTDNPIDFPK